MSDEEDYEYEYDDDDGNDGDNMEEENQFQYTDDEEEQDDVVVALENAYYNAKGLRESSVNEATAALEQVIEQEQEQLQKEGGTKRYGIWSYKALKQLVKLHLRVGSNTVVSNNNSNSNNTNHGFLDQMTIMKYYHRLLECISTTSSGGGGGTDISPALIEKGINTMLERVASLNNNQSTASMSSTANPNSSGSSSGGSSANVYTPSTLALAVYDATLSVFHPQTGTCKIERLWFKTNLKYGQLLYEMNETTKLQIVLRDLIQIHGEPDEVSHRPNHDDTHSSGTASVSTNSMEIYALQIQLYSRLKDNKKLRSTFHKAMNVRGGIPHPRTVALIQELGGKMYMSNNEYEEASKTFFQAFKSYDEAGDKSRLRCLKYLVLASMLHASQINPFDSQEARPYRDDPEIVAMTNLVRAFHNNEIHNFERILRQNQGRIMDDEFIREHIEELLRTIRIQVLRRYIRPYQRISLAAIAIALNDIPISEVESLLTSLILDGKLDGLINRTTNTLIKHIEYGGGDSSADASNATSTNASGGPNSSSTSSSSSSATASFSNTVVKSPTILKCQAMEQILHTLETLSRQNTGGVVNQ